MQFGKPSGRPTGLQLAMLSGSGGLIVLMLLGALRTQQSLHYGFGLLLAGLGCAIVIGLAGCGSTTPPAATSALTTPAGQYSASVVATVSGGANTHTTSLTITVTQ
jgi:hypothetical protein